VPNPAWAAVTPNFGRPGRLDRRSRIWSEALTTGTQTPPDHARASKIAQASWVKKIWNVMHRSADWKARRAAVPRAFRSTGSRRNSGQTGPGTKHLTNLIKMVAYQDESALCVEWCSLRRVEAEGRTLIQTALGRRG